MTSNPWWVALWLLCSYCGVFAWTKARRDSHCQDWEFVAGVMLHAVGGPFVLPVAFIYYDEWLTK